MLPLASGVDVWKPLLAEAPDEFSLDALLRALTVR
jgi:hypothetical protein